MENYKIKVNDEAESKEAQELFFELGLIWRSSQKEVTNLDATFIYAKDGILTAGFDDLNFAKAGHQELTLPQLRDLVAKSKKEQGLISGADAKLAWAKGENVEVKTLCAWLEIKGDVPVSIFDREDAKFRLKPRTITLSLEIPKPIEGERQNNKGYWCFTEMQEVYWDSEEKFNQVVAALRSVLKGVNQ